MTWWHKENDTSKKTYGEAQSLYHPSGGGGHAALFWFFRMALLFLLLVVIIRNIEPYAQWSSAWLGDITSGWWLAIPGVDWFLDKLFRFCGVILWMVFQTLECVPLLLLGTRFGLGTLIEAYSQQASQQKKIETYPTDDAVLKFLKAKYNSMGLQALDFFRMAQPFAYAVDLVVCWQVFPPLKDGYTWQQVITGWNFGGISWGNVASLVITLLAFELVVIAWMRTSEMLFLIRRGIRNA
jgi:hypothetical protein